MINLVLKYLREWFPTRPIFIFDGWFGQDKVGHFSIHFAFSFVALWTAHFNPVAVGSIALYDTLFNLLYEYCNYRSPTDWINRRTIGFSWLDVGYGVLGMIAALWIGIKLFFGV
jgi:hypothetical protein